MVSVTSDVAGTAPPPSAQVKPVRPDPSLPADSFAALVDSNTPADIANSPPPEPPPPAAPVSTPPQTQSAPSQTQSAPARDNAANQPAASPASSNSPAPTGQQANASNNGADPGAPGNGAVPSSGKPTNGKTEGKSSSDKAATKTAADAAASSGTDAQATAAIPVAPQAPVAAVIVNPAATAPATPPPNGDSTTPLVIAASAIATSSSTVATLGLPIGQLKAGTTVAGTAPVSGQTSAGKGQAQAASLSATGAPSVAQGDVEMAAEVRVVAGNGVLSSPTGKAATAKTSTGLQTKTSAMDAAPNSTAAPAATPSPTQANANAAPQPVGAPKQDGDASQGSAPKADKTDGTAPAISASTSHDAASLTAQAQPTSPDPGTQAAMLPQQATPPLAAASATTVALATGAPVPVSGLAVEIAASAQGGKTRFEVRLDPADLGRIDVRIDVNRDGQVTSHLIVEKPETLSMLQQDAPQLQQALSDAGLKTGSGGLQFSLRDQSSFGGGQNNGNQQMPGNAQRLIVTDETSVPAAAIAGQSYGRMLGLAGGVDIRV